MSHTNRWDETVLGKLDVSSQINEHNLIKAGAQYTHHKIFYDSYTLQPILSETDINLAYASPFVTTYVPDVNTPNHDQYYHRPVEFSAYVQDKIEFKDLIVNIGLRYDYSSRTASRSPTPVTRIYSTPSSPATFFSTTTGTDTGSG